MSTPSLKTISSHRSQATAPRSESAVVTVPILPARSADKTVALDTATEKAESVDSDSPVPSSSGVFVPAIPKFSLEKSFPSILSTVELMRKLKKSADTDGIYSLSQVFSTCLRTIIHSMDDLPHDIRLNPAYEVAQYGVVLTCNLLRAEVAKQAKANHPANVAMALNLVDITISGLRSFLKVAERILAENKPLPALPSDTTPNSVNENPGPLINVVDEVLNTEETEFESSSSLLDDLVLVDASDIPPEKKRKNCRGSIIRRIIGRKSTSSKVSIFTHQTKSSVTLVDHDSVPLSTSPKESFMVEVKEHAPEIPYLPRQSAIYYLADPYCPEIDVEMPLPTGDTIAVRLDQHGVMKAASLTALVRILTSKDSVLDQEFTPTFFICFRFFTTPTRFLQELVDRFDEQPPENLSSAQLRIWTRDAMGVHIRVGKTILMWLDLYWKPETDSEVLDTLQMFTLERLVRELPEGMVTHILEGLDLIWGDNPICRRTRKASDLEFIYNRTITDPIAQTTFDISIDSSLDPIAQLLLFSTPAGREELARQLTVRLSEQFQLVDPEDAIKYWHLNEDSEVGRILQAIISFERALCSWVTHSVLARSAAEERREMLEFWLDISARCLRLRNFSGAHCILGGISNGAIGRMKQTILLVGTSSKQQFRALQGYFSGQDNFAGYRNTLTSIEPTVPMISPLIRDVISALAVVPTSIGNAENSEEKNLINLCSYRVVTKTVRAMETCLLSYKIPKSDEFQAWLATIVAAFSPEQETQINDGFYAVSAQLEPKDPLLNHLTDPWSFTISGVISGKHTLHKILASSPSIPPKKTKRCISALLRR